MDEVFVVNDNTVDNEVKKCHNSVKFSIDSLLSTNGTNSENQNERTEKSDCCGDVTVSKDYFEVEDSTSGDCAGGTVKQGPFERFKRDNESVVSTTGELYQRNYTEGKFE